MNRLLVLAALTILALAPVAHAAGPAEHPWQTPGDPTIQPTPGLANDSGRALAGATAPRVPLSSLVWRSESAWSPEVVPVAADYVGEEALRHDLVAGIATPTDVTKADFDEDGLPDLICGYAVPGGSMITLHRTNPDAIYPNAADARMRARQGTFSAAPFIGPARVFRVPVAPDFVAAGDLDNDGHQDVVVAGRGDDSLQWLRGDGHGGLAPAERIGLEGAVTAMVAGEINRADGLADLVVAIEHEGSAALLIFEGPGGALLAEPETVALSAVAVDLQLGQLDADDVSRDLVVAAGRELLIVHGRNRWLAASSSRRAETPAPRIQRIALPAPASSVALGDYLWEKDHRTELAVSLADGSIQLLDAPFWTVAGTKAIRSAAGSSMLTARVSGQPMQDLVLLPADESLQVLRGSRRSNPLSEWLDAIPADTGVRPVAAVSMRLNRDAIDDLVILTPGAGAPVVLMSPTALTFTVHHHGDGVDESPGDGICSTSANDPDTCTFRAAIEEANAMPGVDAIDCEMLTGMTVITPLSALPAITEALTIDVTLPLSPGEPAIELVGSAAGAADGLLIASGSTVVRGLVIREFEYDGIRIETNGNNIVELNFLGTDLTGTQDLGNGKYGVRILDSPSNVVGGVASEARNLISGNDIYGIGVYEVGSTDNQVLGNFIGTDVTGTLALGNTFDGIAVFNGASQNTIGGTDAGAGNVISGNGRGLSFWYGTANVVQGNLIGSDLTGTLRLGNTNLGLWIASDGEGGLSRDNLIGGTAAAAANVVADCKESTCTYVGEGSFYNQFLGNFLGTDITGTEALGAVLYHAMSIADSPDNVVGGTVPGARNIISGNGGYGVSIWYAASTGNEVLGNYIGTDITGTQKLGNIYDGVHIAGATDNFVGGTDPGAGNIISGNGQHGVSIWEPNTSDNHVLGNFIGTDFSGTTIVANDLDGVSLSQGASQNVIGGTVPEARNVISGSGRYGVVMWYAETTGNQVLGNYIGTDVTGTVDLGNTYDGVIIRATSTLNTVGGAAAGAGNVVSGNSRGVTFAGGVANEVLGNFIGTDATGTSALPNDFYGVWLTEDATTPSRNNIIGGTEPGAGNLISSNLGAGIRIDDGSRSNQVLGNLIGTDVTGMQTLANFRGVNVVDAPNNTIGGTEPGAGNVISRNTLNGVRIWGSSANIDVLGNEIAENGSEGVSIEQGSRHTVQGNSIVANGSLGIDLTPLGVTANDPGDLDIGTNDLQNYAVIAAVAADPTGITVQGALDSTAGATFRLEFFSSTACDETGHGEGERYLGFEDVTTDGAGIAGFEVILPGVSDLDSITSTATDPDGSTSEFSACATAACSSLAVLNETVLASDLNTLSWPTPKDVRYAAGALSLLSSCVSSESGTLFGVSSLDISTDELAAGEGRFYIVRPLACGSWENTLGAEPGRDCLN